MATENSASNSPFASDALDFEKPYHALRATSPSHVRRIALGFAEAVRAHPFKRVSQKFLDAVESNTINFIKDRVKRHPSKGKTLL